MPKLSIDLEPRSFLTFISPLPPPENGYIPPENGYEPPTEPPLPEPPTEPPSDIPPPEIPPELPPEPLPEPPPEPPQELPPPPPPPELPIGPIEWWEGIDILWVAGGVIVVIGVGVAAWFLLPK